MGYLANLLNAAAGRVPEVQASTASLEAQISAALGGGATQSGANVTVDSALRNTTVFRCVSLISYTIGMLPLHLHAANDQREKAREHPLYDILMVQPNEYQTAFDFRSLMQLRALSEGNAYAFPIRSMGRVIGLQPVPTASIEPRLRDDWTVEYRYRKPNGERITLKAEDVFHLRGLSKDGINGLSLVKQAAEAIGLAMQTEKAAARLFRNGMLVGGALKHPGKLSAEAFERLKKSMEAREGADQAHKWMILEEGLEANPFAQTGKDSQHLETRQHQIEEIGRVFGVPRPLLMVDDTSWGSGIDVLGQFFVRYGLAPWFTAWEQAIRRTLLSREEKASYYAKFNDGALLRGSMKDQAEFFAKGLGSGGHQPFLEVDEVRGWLDLGHSDDLPAAPGQLQNGGRNEPAPAT